MEKSLRIHHSVLLCLHDSIFNVSLGKLLTNWNVGVAMMVLLGEAKCTAFIVIA